MALDEKEVQDLLNKHDDRITDLETKMEVMDIRLKNIESNVGDVKNGLAKLENTYVTQSTLQMQMQMQASSQLAEILSGANATANQVTKEATQLATDVAKGRNQVDMKRIGLIGTVVTAFVTVCGLIIKAIFG